MVDVTISRGGTSVTLPVVDNSSGTPLISKDVGKPDLEIRNTGAIDPRHNDFWSGLRQYTILGRFYGSNAYSDAITLADFIKSNSNGTPLDLSIPLNDFDDTIKCAPAAGQDESVSFAYVPGKRDMVEVDLALTRVDPNAVVGYDQPASTPTASGSGPIQLSDGSTTVDLKKDISVSRGVGRPNTSVRRTPRDYPRFTDTHKSAYEGFELSFQFTSSAVSNVNSIVDMFSQQLGRSSLTLDFNGVYGLGAFSVVPDGAQALRHVRPAAEEGVNLVPTVNLRVVQ